jgi:CBS-domain-containing membrane protein
MFGRYGLKTELALALMPTGIVILVLILLEAFSKQQLLFSSLASSAFLIYIDPRHPTNSIRTLMIAQLSACLIGYLIYLTAGAGYLGAAISMIFSIAVMIVANAMHPPAVSTALIFAFQYKEVNVVMMFFLAVLLLVILIILQRASIWIIKRGDNKIEKNERSS